MAVIAFEEPAEKASVQALLLKQRRLNLVFIRIGGKDCGF